MKRAFSILMLFALMLSNLTKIGILIDFKINQDFIAEVLCINREKPMTMCNGKCYLSEQLRKAEEQEEKQAPTSKKKTFELLYYCFEGSFEGLSFAYNYANKLNSDYADEFYASSFIAAIFRPPKLNLISLI